MILVAGDSITGGYYPFLGVPDTVKMSQGGLTARGWRDVFGSAADDQRWSTVLLMLGTNDAFQLPLNDPAIYRYHMRAIINSLGTSQLAEGRSVPRIIVATPIPILSNTSTNHVLETDIIPFIRGKLPTYPGVEVLDLNALIRQQPGWESWYDDGVHLWGQPPQFPGYRWMAEQFRNAVLGDGPAENIPEPDAMAFVVLASAAGLFVRRTIR